MAFTYRPTSTLSAALNEEDTDFDVAATTNITRGCLLVFKHELMQVRAVPVAGRVSVRRGYEGTRALTHYSGDTFFIGTPDQFAQLKEKTLGLFGPSAYCPDVCIPGVRATDVNGYEYVLVDISATSGIVAGATVSISKDGLFTAAILTPAHAGPVGILVEGGSSDQWAWALIRGHYSYAKLSLGSSLATSTAVCKATTVISTPSVGLAVLTTSLAFSTSVDYCEEGFIYGMWPSSAATTATTATALETGLRCSVWLQYPYMQRKFSS